MKNKVLIKGLVGLTILGSSALMSCTTPKKANLSRTYSDSTMVAHFGNDTEFSFLLFEGSQSYMTISINMNGEIMTYWGDVEHRIHHFYISVEELKQIILDRFKVGDTPKDNELFHIEFDLSAPMSKILAVKNMLAEVGIKHCEIPTIRNYRQEIKLPPPPQAITFGDITLPEVYNPGDITLPGVYKTAIVSPDEQAEFVELTDDIRTEIEGSDTVFIYVEQQPEFPGGMSELMRYLHKNIKYPTICQKEGIQGRVIVQFIVNEDGSISEAEVIKPVNPLLDSEALRLVYTMPNWIPGKQMGKPVRARFSLPVTFRLSDESTTPK